MSSIIENIFIMILTIAILLGGGYILLSILEWGLKIKTGRREQEGLTDLWIASQSRKQEPEPTEDKSKENQ